MSKKFWFFSALCLLILLLIAFWWSRPTNNPPVTPTNSATAEQLFPGGEERGAANNSNNSNSGSVGIKPAPGSSSNGAGEQIVTNENSPLYQISTKPVSGVFVAGTGATSSVVYVERATGHLYQLNSTSRLPNRLTNTTLPKIYQVWGGGTKTEVRVLARYLKDNRLQNFAAGIPLPTASTSDDSFIDEEQLPALRGRLWSNDVYGVAVSPKQDQLFYLETDLAGTTGYITDWAGNRPASLFSSLLTEWTSQWATSTTVALLTKPGFGVPGYLYWLNTKTKELTPILTEIPGLSALTSPDLKTVLYSGLYNNGLNFGLYDVINKVLKPLPITTLADKCAWSKTGSIAYCGVPRDLPAGEYPDVWYRGEVSTADNIWKISAKTKQAELLFNPKLAGTTTDLDLTQVTLSNDEHTLYFINKHDNQLWALNLEAGF